MARPSSERTLVAWMNGLRVGEWRIRRNAPMEFEYDQNWLENSAARRPLSLSLPLPLENAPLVGHVVDDYFDNLLPDSDAIRRRLQSRFHTHSQGAFDLLSAIGRDCVGAVQLLPEHEEPTGLTEIRARPLSEANIAAILINTVSPTKFFAANEEDPDDFRISIAGAQEKTAFLFHEGQWCRPIGATPTTHIFKLPLGLVGAMNADMRTSIENEWLCLHLLAQFDIPVPASEIKVFQDQKVLIVERFDRRFIEDGGYWVRLPQEDFCQAYGIPSAAKYQRDGGPGMLEIARLLQRSETPDRDLDIFMRTQVLFWLLGATDGHAKNFSIHLRPGGRYTLTPIYDVLSAWPVVGRGANQIDPQKVRLAMAWHGTSDNHYRLRDIQLRHIIETARRCGYGDRIEKTLQTILGRIPSAITNVAKELPDNFPMDVFDAITQGMTRTARKIVTT